MRTLFGKAFARVRTTDPASSHEAAARIENTGKAEGQRMRFLAAVQQHPGLTAAELAQHTPGLDRYAANRRLADLAEEGVVYRGDIRECAVLHTRCMTWWPEKTE